ncbi:hypothetical protein FJZ31_28150 [Candidatus Poribacteria bacterium]|nr:hypothetical protein [Candidatus Poribacteria bacterium]
MRCSTAVIQALMMHPNYRQHDWIMEEAIKMAKPHFKNQWDVSFLLNLDAKNAYEIIDPEIPRLIKTQKSNGLWKIKDSRRISYGLLKALKYSRHLAIMLNEDRFRYDPFLSFREENDYYGLTVRQNIMESLLPEDAKLRNQLASDIFSQQNADGSWNDTVIGTASHIETLLELGIGMDDPNIQKGTNWLFSTYSEDVYRQSNNMGGFLVAHNMFSSQNRYEEFKNALAEKPEWNPVGGCYMHLPIIQTGTAVKTLISLGFENDSRVISACDNLVELRQNYGGWCDSNIRNGLIAQKKTSRKILNEVEKFPWNS